MVRTASAPGKIILCGEYAVVFGHRGVAVPSTIDLQVTLDQRRGQESLTVLWNDPAVHPAWVQYAERIAHCCETRSPHPLRGTLEITAHLPLGRGMGSSTALVVATARCLLGEECEERAREIEDEVNPGHSGLDFAVIWHGRPLAFRRGSTPTFLDIDPGTILEHAVLIDTGQPEETTAELVAWVRSRRGTLEDPLAAIGLCAERFLAGESLRSIIADHHRAQVALGVVPEPAQAFVKAIEGIGGVAKVVGAGSRTGGAGTVLILHGDPRAAVHIAQTHGYTPILEP